MKRLKALIMSGLFSSTLGLHAQNDMQFDVLVYAAADHWHSAVIPSAIQSLQKQAKKYKFGLDWTQESVPFDNEDFFKYEVVLFLNSTGNGLTDTQKENFKKYIHQGGGFVGVHAASATEDKWPWFDRLIGNVFIGHPEVQFGILDVVDNSFPATMHLPDKWLWSDEWYLFRPEAFTDDMNILLTVDEKSYDPGKDWGRGEMKGMGDFHPIAWYQEFEGGRSFYTALGHMSGLYNDENFLLHLVGGIYWAATGKGVAGGTH